MRPFSFVVLVLVSGCAVGPNFRRPAPPSATGYTPDPLPAETASATGPTGEAQRFAAGRDIPGQWWTLFHSKPLNALIEQSLTANPTLTAAQAALRHARENVYAQQGAYYPQIGAGFSASRNLTPLGAVSPA